MILATQTYESEREAVEQLKEARQRMGTELAKVVIGQEDVIEQLIVAVLAGGHCLLTGAPGLAKTLLIKSLSQLFHLKFQRIQFTPDLMPADIVGTNIVIEDQASGRREFQFQKGPIFGQIVLADEINRATPKTQSAMLEAMQEHSVTSGGQVRLLPSPFMVLATQNPIEQEGTYPLPEAQLDRFFFKLLVGYSDRRQLKTILDRTTTGHEPVVESVADGEKILWAQKLVRRVVIADHVQDYAIRLVLATHPEGEFATNMVNQFVRFGSSPRGVQALVLAAKVRAMLNERYHVGFEDITKSVLPSLRHRILLNFEGQAEGIRSDDVLKDIVEKTGTTMGQKV